MKPGFGVYQLCQLCSGIALDRNQTARAAGVVGQEPGRERSKLGQVNHADVCALSAKDVDCFAYRAQAGAETD